MDYDSTFAADEDSESYSEAVLTEHCHSASARDRPWWLGLWMVVACWADVAAIHCPSQTDLQLLPDRDKHSKYQNDSCHIYAVQAAKAQHSDSSEADVVAVDVVNAQT